MPRGKKLVFFGAKMKLLCDVDASKGALDGTRFNRIFFPFQKRDTRIASLEKRRGRKKVARIPLSPPI